MKGESDILLKYMSVKKRMLLFSSSNDGGISKKRKRRRPKSSWIMYQDRDNLALLPRLVIPRVIRNDIRRFYPHMLANVYNTQQYDYMWNFMERYFRQDYRLCEQTLGN